ncbi:MAG: UvrD-helicase domain-containing protein, partial [Anaerolineae bacterium]|nr:UvrD-helicase domain-containing protein [Anaerolineae bacterium]
SDCIHVYTIKSLIDALTSDSKQPVSIIKPEKMIHDFSTFLDRKSKTDLGSWNDYRKALWIELRAYLFGMALPFPWHRQGIGDIKASEGILDKKTYSQIRRYSLSKEEIEKAYAIATQVFKNKTAYKSMFAEQYTASECLALLQDSQEGLPHLPSPVNSIIIDEIQDLTLMQIALLASLGRNSYQSADQLTFLAAGDESQTVYPSGFDWGMTKDLFTAILDSTPTTFDLHSQRRCPDRMVQLIEDTSLLYKKYLTKKYIPKIGDYADFTAGDNNAGTILRWRMQPETNWSAVMQILQNDPNVAIVDCQHSFSNVRTSLSSEGLAILDRVYYTPESIKGLDRKTIIVSGLDSMFDRMTQSRVIYRKQVHKVPVLDNRNIIDRIRVALSRSTDTLILMENENSQVAKNLKLEDTPQVAWSDIEAHIKELNKDIDAFQRLNDFLQVAEESLQQHDYPRALSNNTIAEQQLDQVDDIELQEQVDQQRQRIHSHMLNDQLIEINNLIAQEQLDQIEELIAEAQEHLEFVRDNDVLQRYEEAKLTIEMWQHIKAVNNLIHQENYQQAYISFRSDIVPAFNQCQIPQLKKQVKNIEENLEQQFDDIALDIWKQARKAEIKLNWPATAEGYGWVAQIREDQGLDELAQTSRYISQRYHHLPPPIEASEENLLMLLDYAKHYTEACSKANVLKNETVQSYLIRWVLEMLEVLDQHPQYYLAIQDKLIKRLAARNCEFITQDKTVKQTIATVVIQLRKVSSVQDIVRLYRIANLDIPDEIAKAVEFLKEVQNYAKSDSYYRLSTTEKACVAQTLEQHADQIR